MNNELEWQVVTDPEKLFHLKKHGWEIEASGNGGEYWMKWQGDQWRDCWHFRAKPPEPEKVIYHCFEVAGELRWFNSSCSVWSHWIRKPKLDMTA